MIEYFHPMHGSGIIRFYGTQKLSFQWLGARGKIYTKNFFNISSAKGWLAARGWKEEK